MSGALIFGIGGKTLCPGASFFSQRGREITRRNTTAGSFFPSSRSPGILRRRDLER